MTARRGRFGLSRREAILGYVYVAPWLVGVTLFTIGPLIASLYLSFTRYEIISAPRWIGAGNYIKLFTDDDLFRTALGNTVYYVVLFVPLSIAGALMAALLLNQALRATTVFRTLFFIPSITPVVASALLWVWLFNYEFGPINLALSAIGIHGPPWLGRTEWAKPAIIIMTLWGAIGGGTMIIFLAGLQNVPQHLYEAASIDGAGFLSRFRHVTLPMLSPTIFFNLVIGLIAAFRIFTPAYIATDGGPGYATYFYVLYLFHTGFWHLNMGYASALAWVFTVVVLVLVAIQFRWSSRWVYYEGEAPGK